jgi:signal transduction histidine kinase
MQREVDRVSALGSELLTLTKLDMAASGAPAEPVELRGMIERIAADALYEAQNRADDLRLELPETELVVEGDANLLRRAIENPMRNAMFYTEPGAPIVIRLSEAPGGRVVIEIADQGPGVPESALPHLFEPFYRVDEARARETGGTGIGLAICARVVRLHGGRVEARHNSPSGLSIAIELPLAQER